MIGWLRKFLPSNETRSTGSGFTAELMAARESYISGARGIGELTATVQTCVGLWEGGLAIADVEGAAILDRASMALCARSLGFRGEALFLIRDRLIPCADWDLSTRNGIPRAYRVSVSEAGGGRTETVLAAEVLHIRIGADAAAPWAGQAPLKRSAITAGLLHTIEVALSEAFDNMPLGSQIIPFPEAPDINLEKLGRGFRGRRGRVLLRESVNVTAAGGPTPNQDWRPLDVTPDLSKAMTRETLESSRGSICAVFGVLPALFDRSATGPVVREAQRHLATWTLQPIATLIAEEATEKLGTSVSIDCLRPVQAWDAGGRARALNAVVEALARAKEAQLDATQVEKALHLVDWAEKDEAPATGAATTDRRG
jgi:hypothetical protein